MRSLVCIIAFSFSSLISKHWFQPQKLCILKTLHSRCNLFVYWVIPLKSLTHVLLLHFFDHSVLRQLCYNIITLFCYVCCCKVCCFYAMTHVYAAIHTYLNVVVGTLVVNSLVVSAIIVVIAISAMLLVFGQLTEISTNASLHCYIHVTTRLHTHIHLHLFIFSS